MAKATLKSGELDVHQVTGESTVVNTAYGQITVPNGHWIVYFPGEFELAAALPPETFDNLFEPIAAEPVPEPTPEPVPEPTPAPEPVPEPEPAPEPVPAPEPTPEPAPEPVPPVAGPSPNDIQEWVAGHYAETYRLAVVEKLMANPTRAQELLDKYPLPETAGQAPSVEQV